MKQLKQFYINIPMFDCIVYFYLEDNSGLIDFAKKKFKVNLSDPTIETAVGAAYNLEELGCSATYLVAIDNFWSYKFSYILPVVVHELLHSTSMLLTTRNVSANMENDEIIAYLQQYMFEQFLKKIRLDDLTIN